MRFAPVVLALCAAAGFGQRAQLDFDQAVTQIRANNLERGGAALGRVHPRGAARRGLHMSPRARAAALHRVRARAGGLHTLALGIAKDEVEILTQRAGLYRSPKRPDEAIAARKDAQPNKYNLPLRGKNYEKQGESRPRTAGFRNGDADEQIPETESARGTGENARKAMR